MNSETFYCNCKLNIGSEYDQGSLDSIQLYQLLGDDIDELDKTITVANTSHVHREEMGTLTN